MKNFLLTAILALIASNVFTQERIAVFPFEDIDNVLTSTEKILFYSDFSNEFSNINAGRFSVIPRQDVERLINIEMDFQLTNFSAQEKTAEMNRVLNGTRILSGLIGRQGRNIRIVVSLYTYPELVQLPGGTSLSVANTDELFNEIPELVQSMYNAIIGSTGGTRNIPTNFVRIQGGTFLMGSPLNEPERENDEGPQHQVTVSSFYMSRHEVTQREWYEVMRTTIRQQRDMAGILFAISGEDFGVVFGEGDNYPMYYVSWYDAVEYCNRRSEREGLTPAYTIDKSRSDPNNQSQSDTVRWLITWNRNANGYRLPTEAEWEYACRAGTVTPFNTGNNITTGLANYDGRNPYNNSYNAYGTYLERSMNVGSFAPNTWGLFDMHGNVWEWCWDWYGSYLSEAQTDPQGAASGSDHVIRSGSWNSYGQDIRSAIRTNFCPSHRVYILGFRLVRNAQ
jgi:formylglycine-generating enzyme required for sulfatase activity